MICSLWQEAEVTQADHDGWGLTRPDCRHRGIGIIIPGSTNNREDRPWQAHPTSAHWGIENTLHYVRDVTCREDQARTNAGNAPQTMAALRNTALTLVSRRGFKPVEGFEYFAENRAEAIRMVLRRRTE